MLNSCIQENFRLLYNTKGRFMLHKAGDCEEKGGVFWGEPWYPFFYLSYQTHLFLAGSNSQRMLPAKQVLGPN